MKRLPALSILLVLLLVARPGRADTGQDQAKTKVWKASVEMGITSTTGNTKTKNISAKADVSRDKGKWSHAVHLEALNASTQNQTTAERYYATGKSKYSLTEHNYLFGLATYENNRFSGFHYNATESLGYGRRLIKRPTLTLDVEVGGGLRQVKIIETGESQNEGQGLVGGNLTWDISKGTQFTQDVISNIGRIRSVTRSVTALKTQIVGNLATSISYTFEYTSKPPEGVAKTFTQTSVALVYSF